MKKTDAAPPRYKIGAVAQETGIATETLRVWERRYGVVVPGRTAHGGRLYSDADLVRLRLVKDLVDHGHAISQVARLDDGQLRGVHARLEKPEVALDLEELRARFLDASERLDPHAARQILGRAALLLGTRALAIDFIAPLLRALGDRWAAGRTGVCHEHMASAIVRTVLGGLVMTQDGAEGRPRLVVATPKGELHELGALLGALLAGAAGWSVVYLGPNLPADEICEAVLRTGARAVAISLSVSSRRETEGDLRALVASLPPDIALLAGGAGAAASAALAQRAVFLGDLAALDEWLQREARRPPGPAPRGARS
jgi:DNA-binding transcriptional MerR regulator/methylmalonyl-CoA mutase cobalamin-binding subunit